MVFRNVGVGYSFDDHTRPIAGEEGLTFLQSDKKLVTRSGATKQVADFDVGKDLVDDGDYETGIIDVGGTSGLALALESQQGNSFEVQVELLDDDNNVRTTIDSGDFSSLSGTQIKEVIPVFSDRVQVIITDTSGATDNDVTGSFNFNIGTPTDISTTVSSGEVQIKGADNDFFEDEQLNSPVADSAVAQVTYLARALKSKDLDEFVTRVTDSGGVEVDPLTQDVTQSRSNDEVRTRLYGVDTTSTLVDVNVSELGNTPASTDVAQLTYLARALNSQSLDEFVSRVTDSGGTQIDPLTQDVTEAVATDHVRSSLYGEDPNGNLVRLQLDNNGEIEASLEAETVGVTGDDDDGNTLNVNAETLSQAITDPDGLVTYLARVLETQAQDELRSRIHDSTGTQIDPLTQAVLQSVANDELRSRLFGPDGGGTLQQVNAEAFDTALSATDIGVATYLSRALQSLGQDEVRVDAQAGAQENLRTDTEFVATFRATGIADTNTAFEVVVQNPSGSGVDVFVTPTFSTGGEAFLNFSENITIDTAGTALDQVPKDIQSGSSTAATVEQGGSYTINGTTLNTLLPGAVRASGASSSGGEISPATGGVVLEPGDSVLYEVVNQSGGSANFAIELELVEV